MVSAEGWDRLDLTGSFDYHHLQNQRPPGGNG